METLTLGAEAFDQPGGLALAMKLFETNKDTLQTVSIRLRYPHQLGPQATLALIQSFQRISLLQKLNIGHLNLTGHDMGVAFQQALSKWSNSLEALCLCSCLTDLEFLGQVQKPFASCRLLKSLEIVQQQQQQQQPVFGNEPSFFAMLLVYVITLPDSTIQLTRLCLSDNQLTSTSLKPLASTFDKQKRLEIVDLSGNEYLFDQERNPDNNHYQSNDPAMFSPFFQALVALQHLDSLNMTKCGIDNDTAVTLFQSIEKMPRLRRVYAKQNNFCLSSGIPSREWTQSLPQIKGLVYMEVDPSPRRGLPFQVKTKVVMNFKQNTSLQHFDCSNNRMRISLGMEVIATFLARNKRIFLVKKIIAASVDDENNNDIKTIKRKVPVGLWPFVLWELTGLDKEASAQYTFLRHTCSEWIVPAADQIKS